MANGTADAAVAGRPSAPDTLELEHRLSQLLDEQGHPVRLGDDLLQHLRRQLPAVGNPSDDRPRLGPAQPA